VSDICEHLSSEHMSVNLQTPSVAS